MTLLQVKINLKKLVKLGKLFSRLAAREISAIKPMLDEAGVKLFGVGVEELGAQEFIDGNFFFGGDELYVDIGKASFEALGFQNFGICGLFSAVFSSASRTAQSRAKNMDLGGDKKVKRPYLIKSFFLLFLLF